MEIIEKYNKLIIIFFILASGFLLFWQLGSNTLTNWDEAWFVSVAQDMVVSGNLLAGKWNGQVFFYEPPGLAVQDAARGDAVRPDVKTAIVRSHVPCEP